MAFPLVLLAEDDTSLRQLIALHLSKLGMTVVEVSDGGALHDYLTRARPGGETPDPDIIVSDVDMPGETGPRAIERANFLRAPVVLITAAPETELRKGHVGVVEILKKPFSMKQLVTTIRRFTCLSRDRELASAAAR